MNSEPVFSRQAMERLCLRLSSLAQLARLPITVLDLQGRPLPIPHYFSTDCLFCRMMGSCAEGAERCRRFRLRSGEQAAGTGDCAVARCPAGLVELVAPVMEGDETVAYAACGPMTLWEWDEAALSEVLTMTQDLPLSREGLLVAGQKVPALDSKTVNALAELLRMTVGYDAAPVMERLQQKRQQQQAIAQYVQERKQEESAAAYPLKKEYELIARVREGDRTGAKAILNDLLGEVFLQHAGEIPVIKARVIELVVVVSRAAVESGASLDKLLALNNRVVTQINGLDEFEALCMGVAQVLDEMIDTLYEARSVGNSHTILELLSYVRSHYGENLTLESVARHVYLSPYYVSHLFKEQMGVTFVEYMTRVRVEQAKGLLRLPGISVRAVARQVGYEDAGYFAKVFRKVTGLSPTAYQQVNKAQASPQ